MSNYSQYKITPDKNAAMDLGQTKVRSCTLTSFGIKKTQVSARQRIKWNNNNNNDVPWAVRSEAGQWTHWLKRPTAAYLGSSVITYCSYYPTLNNIRFRFFKRTVRTWPLIERYPTALCYMLIATARMSFSFLPSNFGPVVDFPASDGWKVICWFSTEQEMCFHSYTISETHDLFRSVFEMCILKMPSWNKAEKSFHTVRQLLRTDLRSSRI